MTLLLALALFFSLKAQNVTEIITDYNGYWKSGSSAISAVKPDNSHNLVAFTYNGVRYSTGVNDALLTTHGQAFTAGDYKALPVQHISVTANANTKIALGAMYDGVFNGASNPPPINDIYRYLTDGARGMDIGTGVANLPAGTITFAVSDLQSTLIGDGIPDLLITQIADPSGSSDQYEFADVNGVRVGNLVSINLETLSHLGQWIADFYNANTSPMFLSSGFTQTERPLRLWAADFSTFGINASNINQIAYFRIRLSGNSDMAFVAYNNKSFTIPSSLPVELNAFKGVSVQQSVQLDWQTASESTLAHFEVEYSQDGQQFTAIDRVAATGNSNTLRNYGFTHRTPAAGAAWYRLKQVDLDGRYTYSNTIRVAVQRNVNSKVHTFPNPVINRVTVQHKRANGTDRAVVCNLLGNVLVQWKPATGSTQSTINLESLPTGTYVIVVGRGEEQQTSMILKK